MGSSTDSLVDENAAGRRGEAGELVTAVHKRGVGERKVSEEQGHEGSVVLGQENSPSSSKYDHKIKARSSHNSLHFHDTSDYFFMKVSVLTVLLDFWQILHTDTLLPDWK